MLLWPHAQRNNMDKTVRPDTRLDITEGDYLCGRVHVDQIKGGGGGSL